MTTQKAMTNALHFNLSSFDGFEVHPVKDDGDCCEQCEPHEATFWTVYGHYDPASGELGVEALIDCADQHSANLVYNLLDFLKTVVTKADDLIAAIEGTTDQFEPEVAALSNAASGAEKVFKPNSRVS
ncbi:MAG TPA: hypothetical protein VG028_05555 [Terriglobia bacterium]|nr:hypothetical protein [Terriglobia bacterium]